VLYGDEEIFHKSDISTDPETKTTELDFLVPDYVSGPITIRFENLGGGIFSNLDFPAIVYESGSTQIPDWVKNIFLWYGQGQVSDDEIISAIQYLVKEGIIKLD